MPQPAEVTRLTEQLLGLFRTAQAEIDRQVIAAAVDPKQARRRRRLTELSRTVDAELRLLETNTAGWLQGSFPTVYELGGQQGAGSIGESFAWTQVDGAAVQQLAGDLFDDVLTATSHVRADVKAWIRETARRQTGLSLIEGRTAAQAARELTKAAAGEAVGLLGGPVGVIQYADGSYRTMADYADMLLRTKSAQAFNAGTLNTLGGFGVKYIEVFDGVGCGLTAHNDGNPANGQVLPIAIAYQHPLSHPRCRRSFGGRPDVTSKQAAKNAEPSTTAAQRADQAQAEQDRAERIERSRVARKKREARSGRAPRRPRNDVSPGA